MSRILDLMKRFHLNEVEYIQDNEQIQILIYRHKYKVNIHIHIILEKMRRFIVNQTN
jgi:hypothetical protein